MKEQLKAGAKLNDHPTKDDQSQPQPSGRRDGLLEHKLAEQDARQSKEADINAEQF